MIAADRLINSLAKRLYEAHQEWRRDLNDEDSLSPRWFALRGDLKQPYLDTARELIANEERER